MQDKARPILRGEARVMLRQEGKRRPEALRPDRRAAAFCRGRSRRRRTCSKRCAPGARREAKAQRIPPYVIFHDAVLREIAAVRPADLEELGQIKGVGASKLQRYGSDVLGVIGRTG